MQVSVSHTIYRRPGCRNVMARRPEPAEFLSSRILCCDFNCRAEWRFGLALHAIDSGDLTVLLVIFMAVWLGPG